MLVDILVSPPGYLPVSEGTRSFLLTNDSKMSEGEREDFIHLEEIGIGRQVHVGETGEIGETGPCRGREDRGDRSI